MKMFFRKPVVWVISVVLLIVSGFVFFVLLGDSEPAYETEVVRRITIQEEVNVTGRVLPAGKADLAFERGGKASQIYFDVGDSFEVGEVIAELEHSELSAQLLQAEANVAAEQARLRELERGLRPEERDSYETRIANAEKALTDALQKQVTVQQKAKEDLQSAYDSARVAMKTAVVSAKGALLTATDIQYAHFNSYSTEDSLLAQKKEEAVFSLLGAQGAGRWSNDALSELFGGVFGGVLASTEESDQMTDALLQKTLTSLEQVRGVLTSIPVNTQLTTTEKTNLSTEKTSIESELKLVTNAIRAIAVQKAANDTARTVAQAEVTAAQNILANSESDLTVGNAGSAVEQIVAQNARVASAEAQVANLEAQIQKMQIVAPLSGILTKNSLVVGEIVSPNVVYFSVISEDLFEIEAFIPEADVAKVSLGNTARITLDAYGRDELFSATVTKVDPAETIIDGVATYKITLQFTEEDSRVRSGMTANIDIVTAEKSNVLAVPIRSVLRNDTEKYVRVVDALGDIQEVVVTTGLRGVDGSIEIMSGLNEGQTVVTYFIE